MMTEYDLLLCLRHFSKEELLDKFRPLLVCVEVRKRRNDPYIYVSSLPDDDDPTGFTVGTFPESRAFDGVEIFTSRLDTEGETIDPSTIESLQTLRAIILTLIKLSLTQ